jgi:hypothetical protein
MRRTAMGVGASGIFSTTWFTVAVPKAYTASMIWRSRRDKVSVLGMMQSECGPLKSRSERWVGSRYNFNAVKVTRNFFVNFLTQRMVSYGAARFFKALPA